MLCDQSFFGVHFVEIVFVVIKAIRAFKSGKIGAGRNGGEVLVLALEKAGSTFKRTIRFHGYLL